MLELAHGDIGTNKKTLGIIVYIFKNLSCNVKDKKKKKDPN